MDKQKAYIWIDDDRIESMQSLIAEIFICDAPLPGEEFILYEGNGEFKHYEVTRRIFGANKAEKVGVWNIYLKPIKKKEQ